MQKLLFLSLSLLLSIGCNKTVNGLKLGDTLTVKHQKTIEIPSEKLKITFSKVQDNRCPTGTNCIRAGEAKAKLLVEKEGESQTVEMMSQGLCYDESGECGNERSAMGYRFKLLYVYPHPKMDTKMNYDEYNMKIVIAKAASN